MSFLDSVTSKFGDILVDIGDDIQAISTRSFSLDASIGIGGLPRGRFTEIYGAEGTGKTTIALSMAMSAVDGGEKVLYIDAENMLSYGAIGSMLGVKFDKDKLILVQPETGEQAFMIAEEAIRSKEFALIVIDTVAALQPDAERKKEFDEFTMTETSRMLTKFFRRNSSEVRKSNVAFLILNQVRDKVGGYTQGYNSPGGHALKHYTSVIIPLTKGKEIKVKDKSVGIMTKFVVKKNKLGNPFRSFEIPIIFGKGVDYYSDAVDFCTMLGVIKKNGSYYKFDDITLGQGKFAAGDYLRDNPDTLDKIREVVYNIVKGNTKVEIQLDDEITEIEEEQD